MQPEHLKPSKNSECSWNFLRMFYDVSLNLLKKFQQVLADVLLFQPSLKKIRRSNKLDYRTAFSKSVFCSKRTWRTVWYPGASLKPSSLWAQEHQEHLNFTKKYLFFSWTTKFSKNLHKDLNTMSRTSTTYYLENLVKKFLKVFKNHWHPWGPKKIWFSSCLSSCSVSNTFTNFDLIRAQDFLSSVSWCLWLVSAEGRMVSSLKVKNTPKRSTSTEVILTRNIKHQKHKINVRDHQNLLPLTGHNFTVTGCLSLTF